MKLDAGDQKRAMQWFLGAGVAALLLVIFLRWSDEALSTSDRELRLERNLYEVRTAAASVSPGQSDTRILQDSRYASQRPSLAVEQKDIFLSEAGDYERQVKKASKAFYYGDKQ